MQSYRTELEQLLASLRLTKPALKYEVVLSLTMFALFWGGFLACSGTLTSGYHLIDDWELLISLRNGVQFPLMVELTCVALLVLLSTTSQAVIYAKSTADIGQLTFGAGGRSLSAVRCLPYAVAMSLAMVGCEIPAAYCCHPPPSAL